MKLVKLHAYLQNNLGDDLMVETLVDRYPDVCFWGCRGLQKKTKKLHSSRYFDSEDVYARWGKLNHLVNILLPGRKDLVYRNVFRHLENRCVCAVAVGGSVYRQLDGQTMEERMAIEEGKKARNAPFYVVGANFGPFSTQAFYDSFRAYFATCSGVSFRDVNSFELFRDLPSVQWAPDVVFNIPLGEIKDDGETILISVINLAKRPHLMRYRSAYLCRMALICEYFVNIGKTPVLMSFCKEEGDEECIDEICDLLSNEVREKVCRYFYHGDTEEALELFRKAHFVVATRFHAMVLAMRFGKPLFTISYELKMDNVLQDTSSEAYCRIANIEDILPETMYDLGSRMVRIDHYIEDAEKQLYQLDCFLRVNK